MNGLGKLIFCGVVFFADLGAQPDNLRQKRRKRRGGIEAAANTIDHGPLPGEAIESTVYLSNDKVNWTEAVTERVWLEGFDPNTGILWDGFTYAVGIGTAATFRYASIIWGGPGALRVDGDNEINGVMGLDTDFNPITGDIPIPAGLPLLLTGLAGFGLARKLRK